MEACRVVICFLLSLPGLLALVNETMKNGTLRLVGGDTENVGRVEVYYNNTWGTICDDSWHLRDGDVVCKQMGYERAERVVYRATFGEGKGPIWLDQLDCRGDESFIIECDHNGWGIHDCRHGEDAGIYCSRKEPKKPSSLPVRLSCPQFTARGSCKACPSKRHPDPSDCRTQVAVEGIVEVFYNNTWRPVTAEGWDNESAEVVCGELGYPIAFGSGPTLATLWPNWDGKACVDGGSGQLAIDCDPLENEAFRERLRSTFLKKVECLGSEHRFLDCYFPEFGPHSNPSLQVATVRCGFLPHSSCYSPTVEVEVGAGMLKVRRPAVFTWGCYSNNAHAALDCGHCYSNNCELLYASSHSHKHELELILLYCYAQNQHLWNSYLLTFHCVCHGNCTSTHFKLLLTQYAQNFVQDIHTYYIPTNILAIDYT